MGFPPGIKINNVDSSFIQVTAIYTLPVVFGLPSGVVVRLASAV
jgi:hypothetical protein